MLCSEITTASRDSLTMLVVEHPECGLLIKSAGEGLY